jgi:hypothetical protein
MKLKGGRMIDGEEIKCCRWCVYYSWDLEKCRWKDKFFVKQDDCPPRWCPFPAKGEEDDPK